MRNYNYKTLHSDTGVRPLGISGLGKDFCIQQGKRNNSKKVRLDSKPGKTKSRRVKEITETMRLAKNLYPEYIKSTCNSGMTLRDSRQNA